MINASDQLPAPETTVAGVVGLGLMGTSITACLLAAGHPVRGVEADGGRRTAAVEKARALLADLEAEGVRLPPLGEVMRRFTVAGDAASLADAAMVFEAVTEDLAAKRAVFAAVEAVVAPDAIIGSNTSAIPISLLQQEMRHPERLVGVHWAEPAHITRFMEVICGDHTDLRHAETIAATARRWRKEPSLLRRDIRGFVTNRIMYAMIREAFYLVETGVATVADVDRSLRNDLGSWITLAGPFRFMDLTGIPAYAKVMEDLLPELCNSTEVPQLVRQVVQSGAQGVANAKGFYDYTPESAKRWEQVFLRFSYDIRRLQQDYPEDVGDRRDGGSS
jgi:3-hydroxybutyryl-CoA dehydrogenase